MPDFTIVSNNFTAQINRSCEDAVIKLKNTNPPEDEIKASDYFTVLGYPRLVIIGKLN